MDGRTARPFRTGTTHELDEPNLIRSAHGAEKSAGPYENDRQRTKNRRSVGSIHRFTALAQRRSESISRSRDELQHLLRINEN